jgi:serine/threonine protein kinase
VQSPGQEVGDWALTEPLGAGGLGVTWLAQHKWRKDGPTARVVIKFMLPPGFDGQGPFQAMAPAQYSQLHERRADDFISEAKTLEQLHSDFIPKVLGYGRVAPSSGGHHVPWFAQELIEGPTLDQLLRRQGPLDGGEWFDLAHDLLRAFREAHDRDIKHLDLKLDNVVVHDERAVLIDFGLAVSGFNAEWGSDGGLSGTWGWYPPEHLDGEWGPEDIAATADIFKLGLLLYTAGSGQHPMRPWGADGVAPADVGGQARLEASKQIRTLMAQAPDLTGLSREQANVIKPMLAFEYARRPSARRALALVAPYLEGGSWRAREVQSIIESVPIAHTQDWTRVEVPTYFDGKRPGHQPAPNSTPQSSAAPRIDKAMLVALYRKHRKTPKQIRAAKARFAREGSAIDLALGWGFEVDDADLPPTSDGCKRLTATLTAAINEVTETATRTENLQLLLDLNELTVVHDGRRIRARLDPY